MADFKWYDGSKLGSYGTSHEGTLLAFAYVQYAESAVGGIGIAKSLFSQVCEDGLNGFFCFTFLFFLQRL